PGEFVEAIDAASRASGGSGVLVATVASTMSATYRAASIAAAESDATSVRLVATGTAAGGEGLVVLAAAQAAKSGASLDDVVATAEAVAGRVHLVAAVDGLDHLVKSGRVPGIAGWA